MPRRGNELEQFSLPPKKKVKAIEEPPAPSTPSLDVSFCDDEALTPGIIFTDIQQKKWRIGKPIGRGSFGRIYLASDDVNQDVTKLNARYVIKIEPHTNGPLFVEVHCMIRTAQASSVQAWRQQHNQKRLGMPIYIASGSFTDETSGSKYRFLVLPRYDVDLHKIIARTRSKTLELKNVLVLAIQILDVLEYLHSEGYTHSDIKSSNLMLGFDGSNIGQVPIVRLTPSLHKEIKEALSSKRKAKPRTSTNYYTDEDFIAKDYTSSPSSDGDKRLVSVKKKLRRILADKDTRKLRTLHRHHAFNLRQLTSYVNYEDMNSSVCSDQSYQKLIDDFGNKSIIQTTKQFQESKVNREKSLKIFGPRKGMEKEKSKTDNEVYKKAVLSQSNGQIYLLDYGLASKFLDTEGQHKEFAEDARKAHDGTMEYSSRDSHVGAHSRRSDLETLGYNLLDWITGTLPWKSAEVLAEPDLVHALKKNYMSDLKLLLKTCFKTEFYPQFIEKFLEYVKSLDFTDKPDYDYCRSLFRSELLRIGNKSDVNFVDSTTQVNRNKLCYARRFGRKNTPPNFLAINGIKKSVERENVCSLENDLKLELLRHTLNISSEGFRKPCATRNFFVSDADLVARLKKSLIPHGVIGKKMSPKNLRSKQKLLKKRKSVRRHRNSIGKFGNFMGSARQFTWAEILAGNPEHIIRKERNAATDDDDDDDNCKYRIRKLSDASDNSHSSGQSQILQKDYLDGLNPTDAMKDVVALLKNKDSVTKADDTETPKGYTPAMLKVLKAKQEREKRELEALVPTKKEVKRSTRSRNPVLPSTRVTRQKVSLANTKDEVTVKKSKLTKAETSPETVKSEVPVKKSKLTKAETSPDSAKNELTAKKSKLTKAETLPESAKSEVPVKKSKLTKAETSPETGKSEVPVKKSKLTKAETSPDSAKNEVTAKKSKLTKAETSPETGKSEVPVKKSKLTKAETSPESAKSEVPVKKSKLTKAETSPDSAKNEVTAKKSKLTKAETSPETGKSEVPVKKSKLTKAETSPDSAKNEVTAKKSKLTKAETSPESAKSEVPVKKSKLTKAETSPETGKSEVPVKKSKLTKADTSPDSAKNELTAKKSKLTKAKTPLENAKNLDAKKAKVTKSVSAIDIKDVKKIRTSKSIEPSSRVTRQNASTDKTKSELAPKSNVRTNSKGNKNAIKTVEDKSSPPVTKIIKKPASKKSSVLIVNRMRLRSTKRK